MTWDGMGSKQRAWVCAGNGWFVDPEADLTELWLVADERPVLALSPIDAEDTDVTERLFGWAIAELCEQRCGWISLVRFLVQLNGDRAA